jgi:SAM-dependent methyltransferase
MMARAGRRNRQAIATGRVALHLARAESTPSPDDSFEDVVAVNSVRLWEPLAVGNSEVARVLRPGGSVVVVTHRWAFERSRPTEASIAEASVTDWAY